MRRRRRKGPMPAARQIRMRAKEYGAEEQHDQLENSSIFRRMMITMMMMTVLTHYHDRWKFW